MKKLPKQFNSWLDFYKQVKHLEEQLKGEPDGGIIFIEKFDIEVDKKQHEEFTFLEIKTQVLNEILSEPIMTKRSIIDFYHRVEKMKYKLYYSSSEPDEEFCKVRDILLKLSDYAKP